MFSCAAETNTSRSRIWVGSEIMYQLLPDSHLNRCFQNSLFQRLVTYYRSIGQCNITTYLCGKHDETMSTPMRQHLSFFRGLPLRLIHGRLLGIKSERSMLKSLRMLRLLRLVRLFVAFRELYADFKPSPVCLVGS